jgi:hypothetical protein
MMRSADRMIAAVGDPHLRHRHPALSGQARRVLSVEARGVHLVVAGMGPDDDLGHRISMGRGSCAAAHEVALWLRGSVSRRAVRESLPG